ncbi:MAG: hypothetical protein OEZ34_05640 [Spirochaetia bacterium]|nr:hypothetical protein [Spirochaetia bacterium]
MMIFPFLTVCTPSDVIYKKHVVYNFTTEGFLSPGVLQTIGKAEVTRLDAGLDAGRTRCLEEALFRAKNRAIRVMFHTNLDISGREGGFAVSDFDADYPVDFSERDYIRANVDFSEILNTGYIALQDSRSSSRCQIVFRIMDKSLIRKIKKVNLTFCVNYESYNTVRSLFKRKNFCKEDR